MAPNLVLYLVTLLPAPCCRSYIEFLYAQKSVGLSMIYTLYSDWLKNLH